MPAAVSGWASVADAIVVFGAAVWPGGRASPALARRVCHAAALYAAGAAPLVLVSGGVGREPPAEAAVMRRLLIERGVPDAAIRCDDQSRNSFETLLASRALARQNGWRRVLLVSDGYHLPRCRLTARLIGLRAAGSAVPTAYGRPPAWTLARQTVRDYLAIPVYLLRVARWRLTR